MRKLIALSAIAAAMVATSTAHANGGIGTAVTHTIRHRSAPRWFVQDALCVHSHEAGYWRWSPAFHPGYATWNGYYTGLQFLLGTWRRANGLLHSHVRATTDSPRIVILHAYVIVRQDGGSWREWRNTAARCGLPTY